MKLSVLKENDNSETRVSATPDSIRILIKLGFKIFVEENLGLLSGYSNVEYKDAGAILASRNECLSEKNVCLVVKLPPPNDISKLSKETILIGCLDPYNNKESIDLLKDFNITSICMELIPRISRAQNMDVLSSQANLAGYRSVIDAAEQFGKAFPMMMTAAGRINPAKVMVVGVGVAGLQAIATAKRLGAVVCATDVRISTKEQVESLGAKFIMVEDEENKTSETQGGYAKEMSDEYKRKQSELISKTVSKQDIIICTALIPGKKAPILITEEMLESMAPGSVLVDLAVEAGGNCPLSRLNEIVLHNGVKILGYKNVPGRVAKDASNLYAKNIVNFLNLLCNNEEKKFFIDWNDEIIKAVVLTHNGNLKLDQFK